MFDNPLLRRQIEKYLRRGEGVPEELRSLLEAVNQSYNSYEADRRLIERSMDLSSQELLEVSRTVQRQADRQRIALVKLREVLRALQLDEGGILAGGGGRDRDEGDLLSIAEILKELVEQRNEAERKLQESEARFRLLAENSTDIIGRYDSEGYCLYVSPSCRSLTGYEPEELIGKHFTFGFRPDDHDQVANLRGVMLGASETVTFSYRFRRKDGEYIWLETAVHSIRDPASGRVVESHTASRDVTSRKTAEEKLRRLSIVASRTDNGVIITNSGFHVEWVNESFSRINGYTIDEVRGKRPEEFLYGPLTNMMTRRQIDGAYYTRRPVMVEVLSYGKTGVTFWSSLSITPVLDVGGEVEHFVIIQSDITERKDVGQELQYRTSRLVALIENLQAGVLVEDEAGKVLVVNQILCDMIGIGINPQDLVGSDNSALAERTKHLFENPEQFVDRVRQLMREQTLCIGEELRLIDGRVIERDFIPVFVDNVYRGHLWQCRDITESKHAREAIEALNAELRDTNQLLMIERDRQKEHVARLEELNLMKSEFVSSVSHELRTPLASILGFAQTIIVDPELPLEMRQEFLQIIIDEGKRLAKLINDLLDLARIESGRVMIEATKADLVPVIHRAVQSVKMQAEAKSLSVDTELPQETIIATFDIDRILQVMINLLGNAVKFTPSGGRIGIRAAVEGEEVVITVSDTGLGIPVHDIPYLFEKFYRVHRPGMDIRGTGLGLAIAKHSVELHGGKLTVQSEENTGSIFTIRVPLQ